MAGSKPNKFTDEEIERIRAMRAEGIAWEKIAREFHTTHNTVRRYADPMYQENRLKWEANRRRAQKEKAARIPKVSAGRPMLRMREPPPPGVMEARDRLFAQPQSLSQMLLGDPLTGRSALDRRNNV